MVVRTRFAPSPTGYLHVGGVRTALFSWLYAKHYQGQFILRIEDTDHERSTKDSVQSIIDGMKWLNLDYDEGPFFQTERYARYQQIAEQLIADGVAYRCDCTKERLEKLREQQMMEKKKPRYDGHCRDRHLPASQTTDYVIRFKHPEEGSIHFSDEVYGDITIKNTELDDFILIRAGRPTYNYAVVIDDWDMGITHVIRGDDHINNTPKQIHLFQALHAPIPVFAHLPMILGDDGQRLSKRHGAVSVLQFRDMGYLPKALINYLVRLGWSSGDQEIFQQDELITQFNLQHINRSAASFNYEKLQWINQHYLKNEPIEMVANALASQFQQEGYNIKNGPALTELLPVFVDRCKTLKEIVEKSGYCFQEQIVYDQMAMKKHWKKSILKALTQLHRRFTAMDPWQVDGIHLCIQTVCDGFQLNMAKIAQPLRVAITGSSSSPSIDITLQLVGKQRTLSRLQYALDWIQTADSEP